MLLLSVHRGPPPSGDALGDGDSDADGDWQKPAGHERTATNAMIGIDLFMMSIWLRVGLLPSCDGRDKHEW
jgi:hypothetical protein